MQKDHAVDLSFTVVVCTYNRCELLRYCLESLISLEEVAGGHELIVVDNNSMDGTEELVRTLASDHPHLSYVREEKQGLSHARNRGVRESRGGYVAFVDDECIVPAEWLANAASLHARERPDMMGGYVYPWFLERTRPAWYLEHYASDFLMQTGVVDGGIEAAMLMGGNMFVHRSVFDRIGDFDPDLGMKGGEVGYGEESDLQKRLREESDSAKIWLSRDLSLKHVVRLEKMRLSWVFRDSLRRGSSFEKLFGKRDRARASALFDVLFTAVDIACDLTVARLWFDRDLYGTFKNYIYETACTKKSRMLGKSWRQLIG